MKVKKSCMAALLSAVVGLGNSMAMEHYVEKDENKNLFSTFNGYYTSCVDYFESLYEEMTADKPKNTLYQVAEIMHQRIETPNKLYCALGVHQTVALLDAIAENTIKDDIKKFTGDEFIFKNTAHLNAQLKKNISQSATEKHGNFQFTNGIYALLDKTLRVSSHSGDKFLALGAKYLEVDLRKDSKAAAAFVNDIVKKDTRDKIKELVSADDFSDKSAFVLLHTLYVNASWILSAEKSSINFISCKKETQWVTALELEGVDLQFQQTRGGVTLVSLPTVGNGHMVIRHAQDPNDLKPITEYEIKELRSSKEAYARSFKAPFLSMKTTHNLKKLLAKDLPDTLEEDKYFMTDISQLPIGISDYRQMVTFDMTDEGVEASAATAMLCFQAQCGDLYPNGPDILINSAFTFVYTLLVNGVDIPLFFGQVVDHADMKLK